MSKELQAVLNTKSGMWVEDWIGQRDDLGASSTLVHELSVEDPVDYKKQLRISDQQFDDLLHIIELQITKRDTVMRNAITPRQKLEVTLRYLASGNRI